MAPRARTEVRSLALTTDATQNGRHADALPPFPKSGSYLAWPQPVVPTLNVADVNLWLQRKLKTKLTAELAAKMAEQDEERRRVSREAEDTRRRDREAMEEVLFRLRVFFSSELVVAPSSWMARMKRSMGLCDLDGMAP